MAKILVVDDQPKNRIAYKFALEDEISDIEVFLAENENAAIHKIQKNDYDVIVTDLMMIEANGGIKVLNAAKEKDPLVMVILITAFEKKLNRIEAFALGAFDCLEKGQVGVKMHEELVYKTQMALSFRKNAQELIEAEKKKNLLSTIKNFFDPYVFDVFENNPDLLKRRNKNITIVFWDIRSFSRLNDILKHHPLQLLTGFIDEFFEAASKIIHNHHGVLDKFIGDGIMAIFGAFDDNKNISINQNAINGVDAAFELDKKFNYIHNKWIKKWQYDEARKIEIGLGCGVHTGDALVGLSDISTRNHFTAIGHNVNIAARITQEVKRGKIWISQTTKNKIEQADENNYIFTLIEPPLDFKNIDGKFDVYEVSV